MIQTDDQMLLAQQCVGNLRRILLEARKVHSRQDYTRIAVRSSLKSSNATGSQTPMAVSNVSDLIL